MQLKSPYRVPIKQYTSKPSSSASGKPWISSGKILQKFSSSSGSAWIYFPTCCHDFRFLLILIQLLPESPHAFRFVDLQSIYSGCEKKMLFTMVALDCEQFRFFLGSSASVFEDRKLKVQSAGCLLAWAALSFTGLS